MSRSRARGLLRSDVSRRATVRAVKLSWGGLIAALYVWGIAITIRLIEMDGSGDTFALPRAGDLFSATVDPVLPTLVGALLALAVIKAGGFAPEFIVGVSSLIGGTAIMWMLLSFTALIGTAVPPDAASNAVAAAAMAIVCAAVTIALSEVLPLSERGRRRQLRRRSADIRDRVLRLHAHRAARPVLRTDARPYSPRAARGLLVAWYALAIAVAPLAMLPYALGSESDERVAAFAVGAMLAALLGGLVGLCHWCTVELYESSQRFENSNVGLSIFSVIMLSLAIVAPCIAFLGLVWPIRLLAVVLLMVTTAVLFATFAPMVRPLPRGGLLAQAVVAERSFALQRAGWRYDQVRAAVARL